MKRKEAKTPQSFTEAVLVEGQNFIGQMIVEPSADKELLKVLGKANYDKLANIISDIEDAQFDGDVDMDAIEKLDTYFPITTATDALHYFRRYAKAVPKYRSKILNIIKSAKIAEDIEEDQTIRLDEMSDEDNPEYMFQTVNMSIVLPIALGKLDAKKLARKEMAARGYGKNGKWVGFDQVAKEWKVK